MQHGCDRSHLSDTKTCPALGTKGNNYSSQQPIVSPSSSLPPYQNERQDVFSGAALSPRNGDDVDGNQTSSTNVSKAALARFNDNIYKTNDDRSSHANFALGIFLPIILIASLVMWSFYAYRNPHTKSGQLLIQVGCCCFCPRALLFNSLNCFIIINSQYIHDFGLIFFI